MRPLFRTKMSTDHRKFNHYVHFSPPERLQVVRWNQNNQCTNATREVKKALQEEQCLQQKWMPLSIPPGQQCHSLKKTVKAVYSGQWNLSFWTPLIRGHKILVRKNAHIIYGSNTSIKKGHLYSLERDPFSGSYFNPRLATWAEMSLSQAQNIFMPTTTINT